MTNIATTPDAQDVSQTSKPPKPWRAILPVHPAFNLVAELPDDEKLVLGNDIKTRGLTSPIVIRKEGAGKYAL
jgi:hypothetical protein